MWKSWCGRVPKFSVKWSEAAREDYRKIRVYLGEQAPWYVVELVRDVEKSLWPLREWPRYYPRYMRRPELGLRKIVVGNYLLLYRVLEKQRVVRVVRMFHGAMNVDALL